MTPGRLVVVALVAVVLSVTGPRPARAGTSSADAVIAEARELGLARSTPWRRLLLYRKRRGTWTSGVDGADFFLASAGRKDPDAELEATLRGFFAPVVSGRADKHALCRFPARRLWLGSRLPSVASLQPPPCPALDRHVAEMDAASASFVFASNFLGNPASAFGHTLLRISKRSPTPGADAPMVVDARDHGIDYTAEVDTNNPFLYAAKGLAGLFPGKFRYLQWSTMLREYGAEESRDLWEYELALSSDELALLVLHLWELANTRIDYLYMTENCSYHIIAALDAAAPRLDLVQTMKGVVLPVDTMKAVAESPGLVRALRYRPSVRSRFHAATARLSARGLDLVEALAAHPDTPLPSDLPPVAQAAVLDAARLALEIANGKTLADARPSAVRAARDGLYARRARLAPSVLELVRAPPSKAPHESHGSMRFFLGTGMTSQYDTGFTTFGYRLAYHDLADPPNGIPELLQLQFLDARLRYDHGRRALTLDALTFAELAQIHPLRRFDAHPSWRLRAFGTRLHDRAAPDAFAHGADAALGAAVATRDERLVAFLMADAYVGFAGQIDGIGGGFIRAGIGPLAGLRAHLFGETVALVTGTASYLPAQSLTGTFDVRASLRTRLGAHVAMGLEGAGQPRAMELQLGTYLYF